MRGLLGTHVVDCSILGIKEIQSHIQTQMPQMTKKIRTVNFLNNLRIQHELNMGLKRLGLMSLAYLIK